MTVSRLANSLRSSQKRASKRLRFSFSALTLTLCVNAYTAELHIERTAFDKLLVQALFKDDGRHYLSNKNPCHSFLETPSSSLRNGRIFIRSRLTSKVGVPAGKVCVGATVTSWTSVSAKAVVVDGSVRLDDLRIEEVEDQKLRFLLSAGLAPEIPRSFDLDLRKAVGSILKSASPNLVANMAWFEIVSLLAQDEKLLVRFDFTLVAQ